MHDPSAPYHAHVYYTADSRPAAAGLRDRLLASIATRDPIGVLYVGELRDHAVGPHPQPQFELHFHQGNLPRILPVLEAAGLTVLVHPLTDDDLADHTTLAHWIGTPIELDVAPLDPPGMNQGIARFGRTDF